MRERAGERRSIPPAVETDQDSIMKTKPTTVWFAATLLYGLVFLGCWSAHAQNNPCLHPITNTVCSGASNVIRPPENLEICLGKSSIPLVGVSTVTGSKVTTCLICGDTLTTEACPVTQGPVSYTIDGRRTGRIEVGAIVEKPDDYIVTITVSGTDCCGNQVPVNGPTSYLVKATCCNCQSEGTAMTLLEERQSCKPSFSMASETLKSMEVIAGLGFASFGQKQVGHLYLHEGAPCGRASTPATLQFIGDASLAEIIRDPGGAIRQVRVAQGLADVVANPPYQFEIRFYAPEALAANKALGVYQLRGGAEPLAVCVFENPVGSSSTNRLRFSRTQGARTYRCEFAWQTDHWELNRGGNAQWAFLSTERLYRSTNGAVRTELREVAAPGGAVVARKLERYQSIGGVDYLTESVLDPDGTAPVGETNSYTETGLLLQTVRSDGSWESREFDGQRRLSKVYSAFTNLPPTTEAAQCRVKELSYLAVGDDPGTSHPYNARLIVEKVLGTVVSRQYRLYVNDEERVITCLQADGAWNDPTNLVTVTKRVSGGLFDHEVLSVRFADGTFELHEYAISEDQSFATKTTWRGEPNGEWTGVRDGTKTEAVLDAQGRTVLEETTDFLSGLTTDQKAYLDFDALGHAQSIIFLDGTVESRQYACCGLETVIDRDGTAVHYAYDDMKWPQSESRDGLMTIYRRDAAGHLLGQTLQGTNGAPIETARQGYDLAGRVVVSTNALDQVTVYDYGRSAGGGSQRTTTQPNTGVRVETSYRDGSLAAVNGTAVHGVRYEYGIEEGGAEAGRFFTQVIKLNGNGTDTDEKSKSYRDLAGREYKTLYPDGAWAGSFFDGKGRLCKKQDPDGVVTLYRYNGKGETAFTAIDVDRNGRIDFDGLDRITWMTNEVATAHGVTVLRQSSYTWPTNNVDVAQLVSVTEQSVTTFQTWTASLGLTNYSAGHRDENGLVTTTNWQPAGRSSVLQSLNGRTLWVAQCDALGTNITFYLYDPFARTCGSSNSVTGLRTTNALDALGRVVEAAVIPAQPTEACPIQRTLTQFDDLTGTTISTLADGSSVTNETWLTGETKKTYGSRAYPVEYTHDYAGRMKTMKTWQDFTGDSRTATTTWNYDSQRGWLNSKQYQGGNGPSYTYTAAGRLHQRSWVRGVNTTYLTNACGDLASIVYSDGTPTVTNLFDRQGRVSTVIVDPQGTPATTSRLYNEAGQLVWEAYTGGPQDGLAVTNIYDGLGRRTTNGVVSGTAWLTRTTNGYNAASRLQTVSDGTTTVRYGYLANTPVVEHIYYTNGTTWRMTTTKTYDQLNRLTKTETVDGQGALRSYSYGYNAANQRVALTNLGNSRWDFGYDRLGQVTNGWEYDNLGQPIEGRKFAYFFDDIGNRTLTVTDGHNTNYTANVLNEYTLIGTTTPTHDDDGNLNSDGTWSYTWDGENRLVQMVKTGSALFFSYDPQGRRIRKLVTDGAEQTLLDQRFVYDGWNLVATMNVDTSGECLWKSFVWGLDLSGSEQGAGGVGGLVMVEDWGYYFGANDLPIYDGNGNVMALVEASTGAVDASYEYGPFGELVWADGIMAFESPFRFSTKYQDDETGLVYYGFRYYNPSSGRWLSRDPLGAKAEIRDRYDLLLRIGLAEMLSKSIAEASDDPNSTAFVYNAPSEFYDLLGLCTTLTSGQGEFKDNSVSHQLGGDANSLTFSFCCPDGQFLVSYSLTATVPNEGGPTLHAHVFPNDWTTRYLAGSPPCYTLVVNVPTTEAVAYPRFYDKVRVSASCCCDRVFPAKRVDPPRPVPPPRSPWPPEPPWGPRPVPGHR
jgi:RHS repeat-associated protein